MKQYFKMLISTRKCVFLILSLLQFKVSFFLRAVKRENMAYMVNRAYK